MDESLKIITGVFAIIGGLYAFGRIIFPYCKAYLAALYYHHTVGIHILKNIEKEFGVQAGKSIKDALVSLNNKVDTGNIRMDLIENTVNLGIYICDTSGKCSYVNRTLSEMFGQDKNDMLGYGWLEHITDKQKAFNTWRFSVENSIPYNDVYEVSVNGVVRRFSTEAEPSIEVGIVLGYVGIVKEIPQL